MKSVLSKLLFILPIAAMNLNVVAEEAKKSAEEMAKELANPNTAFASLTFKYQIQTHEGDLPNAKDVEKTTLLFQPSLPFPREDGSKIIFRPAIPFIIDNDNFGTTENSGIGDMGFDLVYAEPMGSDGILLAYGVAGSIPTGGEELGMGETTSIGPELFYGKLSKTNILGIFPNHQWDVGGDIDRSLTSVQAFYINLPGRGWNYGTSPTMSYDHESEEWTIPLNFSFGKTVMFGTRPWKLSMDINYYVEKPDEFGPDVMLSFNISPVVENVFANWFK